jgi:hypothetical protein
MSPDAPVAVTINIAFRPWSGDLILMNAGLAKPIPQVLVYSKAVLSRLTRVLRCGPDRQAASAPPAMRQG